LGGQSGSKVDASVYLQCCFRPSGSAERCVAALPSSRFREEIYTVASIYVSVNAHQIKDRLVKSTLEVAPTTLTTFFLV